jgi:Fe-S-cluster containining protein
MRFNCQMSGECCKSRGEHGFVALEESDIHRMEIHLGKPREQFAEFRAFDSFRNITQPHSRWIIKGTEKQCPFLVDNKCSIHSVKPVQCATWPFWEGELIKNGKFVKELSFCRGIHRDDLEK